MRKQQKACQCWKSGRQAMFDGGWRSPGIHETPRGELLQTSAKNLPHHLCPYRAICGFMHQFLLNRRHAAP
jgi:hypothetical protein